MNESIQIQIASAIIALSDPGYQEGVWEMRCGIIGVGIGLAAMGVGLIISKPKPPKTISPKTKILSRVVGWIIILAGIALPLFMWPS